jgi:EAL domain-containing protein (putative c-di-GMP-specific phosphodiesterase class I)
VRVSGRPAYPDRVLAVLAGNGWPAGRTVLEVTESVVDADSPVAAGALAGLRAHGLSVAIDDFGTGWSSLARLDTLPADVPEIDTGMVSTVTTSPRRARLVGSIVALADALGLRLVAEGVETAEHAAVLAELGCPFAQGWYHGRPAPLAEVLAARVERRDVVGASGPGPPTRPPDRAR